MIRAPRTDPAPCPTGCTCEPCTDPLTAWLGDLPARDGDRLAPWNLTRRRDLWAAWRRRNG